MIRHSAGRPRSAFKNELRGGAKALNNLGYLSTNNQLNSSVLKSQALNSPDNGNQQDLDFYSSQQSRLAQGSGKEALRSIVEIRKSLANPQLLSYKISSE